MIPSFAFTVYIYLLRRKLLSSSKPFRNTQLLQYTVLYEKSFIFSFLSFRFYKYNVSDTRHIK